MKKTLILKVATIILSFVASTFLLYLEKRSGSDFFFSRHIFYLPILVAGIEFGILPGMLLGALSAFSFSPILILEIEKNGIGSLTIEHTVTLAVFFLLGGISGILSQKSKNAKRFYKALYDIERIINSDSGIDVVLKKINALFACVFSFFIAEQDEKFSIISKTKSGILEESKNIILEKDSLVFQVFKNGQDFISDNIFYDTRIEVLPKARHLTNGSLCMVSLKNGMRNLGVIGFCKKDAISQDDLQIFKSIAKNLSLSLQNKRLYSFAVTDTLTGLFNRRFFDLKLLAEIKKGPQRIISLIALDIDFFKKVNDAFGHAKGDEVLQRCASLLRESSTFGFACRIGGEEFAIILPDTKKADAVDVAQRIRRSCERNLLYLIPDKSNITISSGISSYPEDASTPQNLLAHADQLLYRAKENGRNRVEY